MVIRRKIFWPFHQCSPYFIKFGPLGPTSPFVDLPAAANPNNGTFTVESNTAGALALPSFSPFASVGFEANKLKLPKIPPPPPPPEADPVRGTVERIAALIPFVFVWFFVLFLGWHVPWCNYCLSRQISSQREMSAKDDLMQNGVRLPYEVFIWVVTCHKLSDEPSDSSQVIKSHQFQATRVVTSSQKFRHLCVLLSFIVSTDTALVMSTRDHIRHTQDLNLTAPRKFMLWWSRYLITPLQIHREDNYVKLKHNPSIKLIDGITNYENNDIKQWTTKTT
jgi:hypothetical protein